MARSPAALLLRLAFSAALCAGAAPAAAAAEYGSAADLEKALERLRSEEVRDAWVRVGGGPALRLGSGGPRVERLQQRLRAGGDLAGEASGRFDPGTEEALRRFQARHGLEPDGVAGRATVAALDVGHEARVREVESNLEVRRAFEARAEPRYVLVNVPDYRLVLVDGGATALAMKVAVGDEGWATPPIDEEIRTIVVNPVWKLPATIVAADLAPKVLTNDRHLEEKGFVIVTADDAGAETVDPARIDWEDVHPETFPYLVRQEPGPENLLGALKFSFPNREDIYLHDTPHRDVFDRPDRHVSHGCIRLEQARELAVELLRETPGWSREQLDRRIATGETQEVPLAKPVPVHLVYWTAWVAPDGTLQHRRDLYGDEVDPDTTPL
jgi:murein L,D-transpeptidase YcbB/YkuD